MAQCFQLVALTPVCERALFVGLENPVQRVREEQSQMFAAYKAL